MTTPTATTAFVTPNAPFSLQARRAHTGAAVTSPRRANLRVRPHPAMNTSHDATENTPPSPWHPVQRALRLGAFSASCLMWITLPTTRHPHPRIRSLLTPPAVAATSTAAPASSPNTASDVEAAAMTLGAVTLGGLAMRCIIRARKDEDHDRKQLQEQCEKLQLEENERSLRMRRKQMENVDNADALPDDQLMSDLMNRVKSLETDDSTEDDTDNSDASMRHSPIPDRGMGSAVLERPDQTEQTDRTDAIDEDDNTKPDADEAAEEPEELANPEQADMLKRMWNLSSPDKE